MPRPLVRAPSGRITEDGDVGTVVRTTAATSSTILGAADVTGLGFTPAINTTYLVEGYVLVQSAATTTGVMLALAWPTGCTVSVNFRIPQTATTEAVFNTNVSGTLSSSSISGITTPRVARIDAHVVTGATLATGQVRVQIASEIALSQVTALAGSTLIYRIV